MANSTTKRPVSFKLTRSDKFNEDISKNMPEYHDGQIIFVEDTKKIYLDFHQNRVCYSGDGTDSEKSTFRYIGISDTDPLTDGVSLNGSTIVANEENKNKVVVHGTKEFVCRQDTDGTWGWFELGDENATATGSVWEVDI